MSHPIQNLNPYDLLTELYNPEVSQERRLQAGFELGQVGDPRFEAQIFTQGRAILPSLVNIPAGRYSIGSSPGNPIAYADEQPMHTVDLPAFAIGRWPVTHAEYACFIDAEGYQDLRWWPAGLAQRWLAGEEVTGGRLFTYLNSWKVLRENPDWKEGLSSVYSPAQIEFYSELAGRNEVDVRGWLETVLEPKSRQQPAFWDWSDYNNPSQPVTGVTWFEARAYCAWLSAASGRTYRLASEAEWEAAARGPGALDFPWGSEWEAGRANTLEAGIGKPSPVGAFAASAGLGPYGAEDLSGNVKEWTASLYQPYPNLPLEEDDPQAGGLRVLRGSAWDSPRQVARSACRTRDVPDYFSDNAGFRVVSPYA